MPLCTNKIDSKFTRSSNSRNTRVGNGAEGVLLEVKRVKDMMKKKNKQECAEIHSMVAAYTLLPHKDTGKKVIIETIRDYGKKLTSIVNLEISEGRGLYQIIEKYSNIEQNKRRIKRLMRKMGDKTESVRLMK